MADDKEVEKTIAEDLVVTKYKLAGQIVNRVLEQVIAKCVPDASAREICEFGDKLILEETSKVFKKEKDSKKGIAFSTCVSVNNCICHFSPIPSESDYILKQGDLAKIDLGAHIDGFIAVVAHTVAVGGGEVTGRAADVLLAAHLASEAALRLLRPNNENYAITDAIQKISAEYGCKPVEGMLSHQLKQFRIDGEKSIIQNPSEAQRKEHEKATFETYEVYAMDVLISTGEGIGREMDTRCTIYKKTDEVYQLKLKASRMFYSEVRNKHGSMPFNLRSFDKETSARLGVVECVNHKLIEPFQVLYERPGELVAQFKFTALLLPSGTHRITGLPFDKSQCKSERSIKDPELNDTPAEHHSQQDSVSQSTENNLSQSTEKNLSELPRPKKRPRINQKDEMVSEALTIMKNISERQNASKILEKDEDGLFGDYIAGQLRKMERSTKAIVRHRINNIIFEAETGSRADMFSDFSRPSSTHSHPGYYSAAPTNYSTSVYSAQSHETVSPPETFEEEISPITRNTQDIENILTSLNP